MDYELYHDESNVKGYWHGILFVPFSTKALFLNSLCEFRKLTRYENPLSLKSVKSENRVFSCADVWVQLAVGAMISKLKLGKHPITLSKGKGTEVEHFSYETKVGEKIGAKFVVFRDRDSFANMSSVLDHGGKVETSFRMAIKGGMHFLGSEEEPINITKIHFDGYEHYGRTLDSERIIKRITGLRDYCTFSEDIKYIIDDGSSDHNKRNSQAYEDCQFLQLTDLLVGSFRVAGGYTTNESGLHEKIAEPIRYLIDKYKMGYARMKNSRWKNAFCMSQCYLHEGEWVFEPIESADSGGCEQLKLF